MTLSTRFYGEIEVPLIISTLALYERSFWFPTASGEGKVCWDAYSGVSRSNSYLHYADTIISSFGLLHRIPPPPGDRELGTVPPELFENPEEFEEQQLFVPADFSQQEEQYNGWSKNFHSLEEEEEFEEADSSKHNGHNGHAHTLDQVHHHDHDHEHDHEHDHDHDHDHNHDHHSQEPFTATPFRLGSSTRRVMTPTPTRPGVRNGSGTYTNGDSRP